MPFDLPSDLLGVTLRTLTVYLFLLLILRLSGKRELGQLTPFELVVILLLSDAVRLAAVGQVHLAVLETDGTISIVPHERAPAAPPRTEREAPS